MIYTDSNFKMMTYSHQNSIHYSHHSKDDNDQSVYSYPVTKQHAQLTGKHKSQIHLVDMDITGKHGKHSCI